MKVKVVVDGYSHDTSVADPDDRWDRPDTAFIYSGCKVFAADKDNSTTYLGMYGDSFEVEGVKPGDTVYVVIVHYTTGNTFGTDTGTVQVMDVFTDRDKADELIKALEATTDRDYSVKLFGKNYYVAFRGYFERLEYISTETATVQNPKGNA